MSNKCTQSYSNLPTLQLEIRYLNLLCKVYGTSENVKVKKMHMRLSIVPPEAVQWSREII